MPLDRRVDAGIRCEPNRCRGEAREVQVVALGGAQRSEAHLHPRCRRRGYAHRYGARGPPEQPLTADERCARSRVESRVVHPRSQKGRRSLDTEHRRAAARLDLQPARRRRRDVEEVGTLWGLEGVLDQVPEALVKPGEAEARAG